ncbi:MAG: ribonuclease P protein component [Prevotella sp.]|nr:ribonuclease P protein component [Prevotella sp.]
MTAITLRKAERLNSKKAIDTLFTGGGSSSMSAFPIRVVYRLVDQQPDMAQVQMLVSVPKKHFKRAVKRNRVKRQIREAYRQHKQILWQKILEGDKALLLSFIWLDDNLHDSTEIESCVTRLLTRIAEKL